MRVKLTKNWSRRGGKKIIPKGTEFQVTKEKGAELIRDKIAKRVKVSAFDKYFKKRLPADTPITKDNAGELRKEEDK